MLHRYTAKIYFDKGEISQASGENIEELYNWMLITTYDLWSGFHAEIVDNRNGHVVKRFHRSIAK